MHGVLLTADQRGGYTQVGRLLGGGQTHVHFIWITHRELEIYAVLKKQRGIGKWRLYPPIHPCIIHWLTVAHVALNHNDPGARDTDN